MIENKNLPAFPQPIAECGGGLSEISDYNLQSIGLSKREYFAAMAMQGLLAGRFASEERFDCSPNEIAFLAIDHAEELIKQLSTPQP